jgi:hypothetical protein
MLDRFRELRGEGSYPSERANVPVYPQEFYLLWYRLNVVRREIVERWESPEEAQITPELDREVEQLQRELQEVSP